MAIIEFSGIFFISRWSLFKKSFFSRGLEKSLIYDEA